MKSFLRHALLSGGGCELTLEELLDVLVLAGERQATQLDKGVLLHEILTLEAHLELFRLSIENFNVSKMTENYLNCCQNEV